MDSNPILYQSEHCKTCKKYKINGETTKINEEKNHQYIEHKKSHNNLLKSDIIDIQERFNQLCL
jgi:glutaredoxin-related protein